jgi:hypothetical protein
MANPAVDAAIKGLEAIGIPVPPGANYLIELLVNEGEDALSAIPHLISVIEQLGGDAWSTLEEVASGMAVYGPAGYVERKIREMVNPHIDAVHSIHQNKQNIIATHRAALNNLQTRITQLAPGGTATGNGTPTTFTGEGADAMLLQFNTTAASMSQHLNLMEQSLQLDQTFFTNVDSSISTGVAVAIIALIIVAVIIVVAIALAPETGGGSLAFAAGGVMTAGGGGGAGAVAWVLGGIIACFTAWAVGHELLTHQFTISMPLSKPQVMPINLTKYPDLDPKQTEAANELGREFKDVNIKWIRYLIHVLGLQGLSAAEAQAVIRCLKAKGYLDITDRLKLEAKKYNTDPGSVGLDPNSPENKPVIDAFKKAWNALMDQLNPRTLQGAWAESNGIDTTIPELGSKDHVMKVENGIQAVNKVITALEEKIADYRTTPGMRVFYRQLLKFFTDSRDFANKLFRGGRSDGPSTWDDPKGEVPFGEDLIAASGCLPS